jgi:hypothetical protein
MLYKNTSVKFIVEKLYRDFAHQEELDLWDLVEWAGEALEFIGAGSQFENFYQDLQIKNHRALLPCNFHSLLGISHKGLPLPINAGTLGTPSDSESSQNAINAIPVDEENFPLETNRDVTELGASYEINNNYLIASFEEDEVLMAYKGVALDDEGFPLIPDNVYYRQAITNYCQMMMDRMGWRAGKLPEAIYRDSQRDWQFFCQGARSAANFPNVDKMESIKNQWIRLKPQINRHDNFFQDLNLREQKKLKGN